MKKLTQAYAALVNPNHWEMAPIVFACAGLFIGVSASFPNIWAAILIICSLVLFKIGFDLVDGIQEQVCERFDAQAVEITKWKASAARLKAQQSENGMSISYWVRNNLDADLKPAEAQPISEGSE